MKKNASQIKSATIKEAQNMFDSNVDSMTDVILFDWFMLLLRFSKIQWLLPSSSTWFHHRKPTSKRPVIFFTVQKSNDNKMIIMTNMVMKFVMNKVEKMYNTMARVRKSKWNNNPKGCLLNRKEIIKPI